jgi:ubiquinone biosynthesis protein Coq4
MHFLQPEPAAAEAGLRAMRQLTAAGGRNGAATRNLLAAAQRHVLHTDFDIDALAPITPQELAAAFRDPALARQFVQGMAVVSLAEGPPTRAQATLMRSYAKALGVDEPALRVLNELAHHHMVLFRLDFLRRSHLADAARGVVRREGFLALAKAIAASRGLREDRALAARYEALGNLPRDTVGHAFWRHCTEHGFAFPGAPFGFPEAGVYHDFTHVLSGYGIEPADELQVGGFTAGYKKHTPIFVILFVMLTFSAGVNVTPVDQPEITAVLAQEGLADRFFEAVERGSQVNTDLSDNWDHWAWVAKPLEQARAELNVPPLRPA